MARTALFSIKALDLEIRKRDKAKEAFNRLPKSKQTAIVLRWGSFDAWHRNRMMLREIDRKIKKLDRKLIIEEMVRIALNS